jgi:hypothetical protein
VACGVPPKYQRPQRGSIADEVEPRICELLQVYPRIGWTRSIRVLPARVAEDPVRSPLPAQDRRAFIARLAQRMRYCEVAHSAGVGFGMERIVLGLIGSRGLEPALCPTRACTNLGWTDD